MRLILWTLMTLSLAPLALRGQPASPSFDRKAFASDFQQAVTTLREGHPKLQLIRPRRSFDSLVSVIEHELPSLDRDASYLALVRVVASLEDGHTGFELASLGFHRYPVEVGVYSDGLFITRSDAIATAALGWKLKRIGALPIDTVVAKLRRYLTADNDFGRLQSLPPRIVTHEFLYAIGAASEKGTWFVGSTDSIWLARPTLAAPSLTASARDTTSPAAAYLANRGRAIWWQSITDSLQSPLLYMQINSLTGDPRQFGRTIDSLFLAIDSSKAATLVIDLRNNQGGDGTLSRILVHRLIQTPAINQRDHLYVITGRTTFSAAVILASALEQETNAIFVGEPTGAPANHYGEPGRIQLPETKLRFTYSRLYWQNGDPRDDRHWIAPTLPTPLSFVDWQKNRDPALETILALHGRSGRTIPALKLAGDYSTRVTLLTDNCGGTGVQDNLTTVLHDVGSNSVRLVHAGKSYEGVVNKRGAFSTTRNTFEIGGISYDIDINGEFSGDGMRALVQVQKREPSRVPCSYTVLWSGLRTNGFNVIPGK